MVGKSLSHYKILEELGRGGMGIVYKAEDTKLDRTVAIKVLPPAALASEDDRARFYREAKAAAQLHHPNIAVVHEIDEAVPSDAPHGTEPSPFIAMEFIEGKTLGARIKEGPLKLEEAVHLASEIASGLEAAHKKNIVHRDIKAANIMLDEDGKAKILDFGLAQTAQSTKLTRMGSTLGTIAYMSPEQARSEEVDLRTDLWSLGVVIYEMIAGKHPFPGDYEQAAVYSILNEPPEPLTALRTGVPMNLEWIVNKCLAKSADDRYQSASDLVVDLRNLDLKASEVSPISTASMSVAVSETASTRGSLRTAVVAAAFTLLLGLLIGFLAFRSSPEPQPLVRVTIDLPGIRNMGFPAMSPTREYLTFSGSDSEGHVGLFLRDMASGEIRYIEGSESSGAREILFSPDGERLAFTRGANGGVFTLAIPAGLPERQTQKGRVSFWEDSNTFIFVDDVPGGDTYRKILGPGEPELVTLEHGELTGDYVNIWKTRIPESDIVFGHRLARGPSVQTSLSSLVKVVLENGNVVKIVESPIMNPEYVKGGFLAYQQRNDTGVLVVRPIDPNSGEFTGPPQEALGDDESTSWGAFSITASGDLIYIPFASVPVARAALLFLVDLENKETAPLQLIVPTNSRLDDVVYSPDGTRLAFSIDPGGQEYIALYDLRDQSLTQITFGVDAHKPIWSPDGNWIYYSVEVGETWDVFRKTPDASSTGEPVVSDARASAVSPDGRFLAIAQTPGAGADRDLMLLNLDSKEITPIDTSAGIQDHADFSPDGQYIAYQHILGSFELRVASVDGSRISAVPDVGGITPRWSSDGKSIYFTGPESFQIPVRTSPSFNVLGEATPLFSSSGAFGFDVSRDEKTVAIISAAVFFETTTDQNSEVVWLQNWSDHLKREFAK